MARECKGPCKNCRKYGHTGRDCTLPKKPSSQPSTPTQSPSTPARQSSVPRKFELNQVEIIKSTEAATKENHSEDPLGNKFQLNHMASESATLWEEAVEKKMVEDVLLLDLNSNVSEYVLVVLDTGADLTVVSPKWIRKHNIELNAWDGPTLVMANGTEAEVMGSIEIEVSNSRGKATGTAVVMKLNGHELLRSYQ